MQRSNNRAPAAAPLRRRSGVALQAALMIAAVIGPGARARGEAVDRQQLFSAIRIADMRLATIGYRLATANAPLCDRLRPETGIAFHGLGQYAADSRADAKRYFGFAGPVAVEGVVPGSAGERAGVQAGDTLLAVNGGAIDQHMPADGSPPSVAALSALDDRIAALPPTAPLRLDMGRGATRVSLSLHPVSGCRSRFELLLNDSFDAQADGNLIQIGSKFLDSYRDDELAVIVAHELSHNILHHRERLEAAKVNFGLLAEIGKNGRLFRRTEGEADELGVYVLANAGFDPMSAARFWRGPGGKIDGGLFRARTHAGAASRAKATEAVAARITPAVPRPITPPLLETRNAPLR